MKSPIIFSLSLLTFGFCQAQTRAIDSLRNAVHLEKDDTNKVITLNNLGEKLRRTVAYDSALACGKKALELANTLSFERGKANALVNMGLCYNNMGKFPEAVKCHEEALSIFTKKGNKKGMAKSLNSLGLVYLGTGEFPKALEYLLKSLSIAQEMKDTITVGICYNNIGNAYNGQNNHDKALEYYLKANEIFTEKNFKHGLSNSLMNIGSQYSAKGDNAKALEYYTQSLPLFQEENDKEGTAYILGNIAQVYYEMNNLTKAMEIGLKSLELNRQTGAKTEVAAKLSFIGDIYTKLKKYDVAEKYLDSALSISKATGEKEIVEIYASMAELDSAKGDYKKELDDYKNYTLHKDSLNNEATIKKTTQAEMNYEFGRKTDSAKAAQDILNAVADKEKQRQEVIRNSFIGGFALAFFASGIFFFQRRKIATEKHRLHESNKVKDKLFSILSHDLRSPLVSIDMTIPLLKGDDLSAESRKDIIGSLEDASHVTLNMIDNLFEWSFSQMEGMKIEKAQVNLDEIIRECIALYSGSATKKGIALKTELQTGVEAFADRNIVRLVMRNLMNNAIKYTDKGGTIMLATFQQNGYSGFNVKDSGIGIPEENLKNIFLLGNRQKMRLGTADEKSSGLGLAFCNELMLKSGGEIKIESKVGEGTSCSASFPVSGV